MQKNRCFVGLTAATLSALFFTSACRDSATGPEDMLIDAEILEVAKGFSDMLFSGLAEADPDVFGGTNVFSCSDGTVTVQISEPEVDDEEGVFISFTYDANPQGCAVSLEGGAKILIYGNPGIAGEARMSLGGIPGPFSLRINAAGGFRYEASDGRSGRCEADFTHTIEGTLDFTQGSSATEDLRGTICGVDVDYRATVEL